MVYHRFGKYGVWYSGFLVVVTSMIHNYTIPFRIWLKLKLQKALCGKGDCGMALYFTKEPQILIYYM